MSKSIDGLIFLAMASFWALNYPLVKFALLYESPLYLLVFRVLFAAIASFVILAKQIEFPRDLKTHLQIAVVGLLNIVIFMGLWFTGEKTESASLSSILVYTYPLIAMSFSVIFLGERLSGFRALGAVVGFIGMVFIFIDQLVVTPGLGILFLVGGAVSWGAGTVYFKKYLTGKNIPAINSLQFLYSLPFVFLWATLTEKFNFSGFGIQFISIALYMGIFGTAMAYLIYLYLFRKYSVSSISAMFFTVPALSIVFSFFLLSETNSIFIYIGFALISAGIYLSSRASGTLRSTGEKASA